MLIIQAIWYLGPVDTALYLNIFHVFRSGRFDLEFKDITVTIGNATVLQGVGGYAREGELLAILGASGKSNKNNNKQNKNKQQQQEQ